tara:strand:- start:214 stop:429 length:216 start_codon:yes stop_codon:yes gene_type:complete
LGKDLVFAADITIHGVWFGSSHFISFLEDYNQFILAEPYYLRNGQGIKTWVLRPISFDMTWWFDPIMNCVI